MITAHAKMAEARSTVSTIKIRKRQSFMSNTVGSRSVLRRLSPPARSV